MALRINKYSLLVVIALVVGGVIGYSIGFSTSTPMQPPSRLHPLGTDPIGRDVLELLLKGSLNSICVAFLSALLSSVIAGALILVSYHSNMLSTLSTAIASIFLSIPRIPFIIASALFLPLSPTSIALVFSILSWPHILQALLPRARQIKAMPYSESAIALGASYRWLSRKYIIPELTPPMIASASITASQAVIAEAGISLLGLGDPSIPSWGRMIYSVLNTPGSLYVREGVLQAFLPLLFIIILSFSIHNLFEPETRKEG